MAWQVSLALRGDLQKFMDAEVKAGKRAVTTTIRRRVNRLKNDLRRQVRRAGLKDRLANSVRGDTFPKKGASLNAAGRVYSKAIVKRPGGVTDLIQVLDQGALVQARGHKFLAIANPKVVQLGRGTRGFAKQRTPKDFPAGSFLFRPTRKANVALLVKRNDPTKIAFVLVKVVRLKKKIDIARAYLKAVSGLDYAVAEQWERNSLKNAEKFGVTP